jgi:hypothetical protein
MGDRRMLEIRTSEGSLYVYTHWCGAVFEEMANDACDNARDRWNDEPYALRILVDQLTKPGRDKDTGFGLMLTPSAEDEYNHFGQPSLLIDLTKSPESPWAVQNLRTDPLPGPDPDGTGTVAVI